MDETFLDFLISKDLSERSQKEAIRSIVFLKSGQRIKAKSSARYEALRWARDLWAEFSGEMLEVPDGGSRKRLKPAVSMPDDQWLALYELLEQDPSPQGAVLRVMMSTGLRIGDVLRVPLSAIPEALARPDGLLEARVKGGKTIKSSVAGASRGDWTRLASFDAPTPAHACAPGADGSADAGGGAYRAVSRHLKELAPKAHLHRLRRTVIVQGLRAGMDVVKVAALVGHSSIKTTSGYADETHPEIVANVQDAIAQYRRRK